MKQAAARSHWQRRQERSGAASDRASDGEAEQQRAATSGAGKRVAKQQATHPATAAAASSHGRRGQERQQRSKGAARHPASSRRRSDDEEAEQQRAATGGAEHSEAASDRASDCSSPLWRCDIDRAACSLAGERERRRVTTAPRPGPRIFCLPLRRLRAPRASELRSASLSFAAVAKRSASDRAKRLCRKRSATRDPLAWVEWGGNAAAQASLVKP